MDTPRFRKSAIIVFALLLAISASSAPRFRVFPSLVGGYGAEPLGISDDGRVVVGFGDDRNFEVRAIWQQRGQRTREVLPFSLGQSYAHDVSADGNVIVGRAQSTAGLVRGFYWNRKEGFVELSANPDLETDVYAVSGDGRIVVGTAYDYSNPSLNRGAFRWSAAHGFEPLDNLGGNDALPDAVNHTGNVIVGSVQVITGRLRACRWLTNGVADLLGSLGGDESNAYAVSPDGTVIVGGARLSDESYHAFRWTLQTGMQRLDTNGGFFISVAQGVSANGHMVGYASTTNEQTALIWTPESGQQEMDQVFGKALPHGWHFYSADAISADGRWIVGTALSPRRGVRGYILDTGTNK